MHWQHFMSGLIFFNFHLMKIRLKESSVKVKISGTLWCYHSLKDTKKIKHHLIFHIFLVSLQWLDGWTQRLMVSGITSSCWPVTSGFPGLCAGESPLSMIWTRVSGAPSTPGCAEFWSAGGYKGSGQAALMGWGKLHELQQGTGFCFWVTNTPGNAPDLGKSSCKGAWQKSTWGCL